MFLDKISLVKRIIVASLVVMMTLVLFFATLDLGWILVRDLLINEPVFLLSVNDLMELFGLFLLVLIGIELLDTVVKTFLMEKTIHVEIVVSVGIIAIARKIIILDPKDLPALTLIGMAATIFSLCAGYYLLRKSRSANGTETVGPSAENQGDS